MILRIPFSIRLGLGAIFLGMGIACTAAAEWACPELATKPE